MSLIERKTDRERAIIAIRRGIPLGNVVRCACNTIPPTRAGCFGVCEDAVDAIIAAFEEVRTDATAELTRLQARVAELEAENAWRPIETAPKDSVILLAFRNGSISMGPSPKDIPTDTLRAIRKQIYRASGEWPDNGWMPTHWRYPPSPPSEAEA